MLTMTQKTIVTNRLSLNPSFRSIVVEVTAVILETVRLVDSAFFSSGCN